MDPHSFFADPDPVVFLNADPDPGGKINADPDPQVHNPVFLLTIFSLRIVRESVFFILFPTFSHFKDFPL